jgi:TonB family protein
LRRQISDFCHGLLWKYVKLSGIMRTAIHSFAAILMFQVLIGPVLGADKKKPKPLSAAEVFKRSVPAIVAIDCLGPKNARIGTASGFLVADNGKILTNLHVIQQCQALTVRLSNGDAYDSANVIEVDARKDIALIRIRAVSLPVLALGDSNALEIGQAVYSIGNPSGLQNTLQQGLVSGYREMPGYRVVQVSASINPGNSGGPVLDDQGNVIAIAAMKIVNAENLGFAIPINYAKGYLDTKTEISFATFATAMKQAIAAANNANASSVPAPAPAATGSPTGAMAPPSAPKQVVPPNLAPATPIELEQRPSAYRIGNGVSAPSVTSKVDPVYTQEALQTKLSGTVLLSLVVDEAGLPQNVKVVRSLESGLDQKAIEAVQEWRFKPGMKDGKPVPVIANVEVNFRSQGNPSKPGASAPQSTSATSPLPSSASPTSPPASSAGSTSVSDARTAEAKQREGVSLLNQGKTDEAIAAFNEAIRLDPNFGQAYIDRCRAYSRANLYAHAVEDCDRAVTLRPTNAGAYVARAQLNDYRSPDQALRDYAEAIRLDPNLEDAYVSRGKFYMNHKNLDKNVALAIQDFSSAIKLAPNNSNPYVLRGDEFVEEKDFTSAISDFDDAIRLAPGAYWFYNIRGDAYRAQGKYQQAVQDYDNAIRLNSGHVAFYDATAFARRAQSKEAMGQTADLVAPKPISPSDGTVFDQFPRKTALKWSEVKGASSYIVEWDYKYQNTWSLEGSGNFNVLRALEPTLTFDFVGAGSGRWRIYALDASGAPGAKSEWRDFRYTK